MKQGTQVLYHTDAAQRPYDMAVLDEAQPLAATISMINTDGTVNLGGFDHAGASFKALSVPLGPTPVGDYYIPAVS